MIEPIDEPDGPDSLVLTTSVLGKGRAKRRLPTVKDHKRRHVYMFEPSTPGYAILMSMIDGTWPDTDQYERK